MICAIKKGFSFFELNKTYTKSSPDNILKFIFIKNYQYNVFKRYTTQTEANIIYTQGQHPENDIKNREYFYYIDHQGMLFLDDAKMKNFTSCFKEKKFLKFFFNQLRRNDLQRYPEFPFISLCGKERNFIRCDDLPIVFTHLLSKNDVEHLSYAHAGELLTVRFQPEKLCMQMETGRVYHPGPEKGGGVGLVRSQLSIRLSSDFIFKNGEEDPPTHFTWKGNSYQLTEELVQILKNLEPVRMYSLGISGR